MKKDEGSDSLYRLVLSLDANEKGYVKKFLKRTSAKGNVSLKIFLALEKQSEYNEVALKKIFKNYAVVKVHAWDAVMDALFIYNKNQTLGTEINHAFNKVAILHAKGLTEETKRVLDKYIQKCYDIDEYHALIKLLALRSNLSKEFKNPKQDLESYEFYAHQIQTAMERLNQIYLFADEAQRFFHLQLDFAKDNDLAPINEFYQNSYLSKTEPTSKQALKIQDDFLGVYYHILQDYSSSIKHLKRSLEFIEMKMVKSGYFDFALITSSKNLLNIYLQLNQYEPAQITLNNLKNYAISNKTFKKIQEAEIYHYQLSIFNRSKQLPKLQLYLQENDAKITDTIWDYPKEAFRNSFQIQYLISLLLVSKHKEAVRWILQCNSEKYFRDNIINFQCAMLIELTLHSLLEDLDSATKKAMSILKGKVELGDFTFVFKALTISDKTKRTELLSKAVKDIKELKKNELENPYILFRYFDVLDWMEAVL